jgi:glutathione S-transferase
LVGNALTIADLTIACSLTYAERTGVRLGDYPNIQGWFARITQLEAWATTAPR